MHACLCMHTHVLEGVFVCVCVCVCAWLQVCVCLCKKERERERDRDRDRDRQRERGGSSAEKQGECISVMAHMCMLAGRNAGCCGPTEVSDRQRARPVNRLDPVGFPNASHQSKCYRFSLCVT